MKYLFERLGDKRFQNMCAALIVDQMKDVEVFPVGQADAGWDITAGKRGIVLQVKFTRTRVRNPVGWIKSAVDAESANIKRLVAKGCKSYTFMTNSQWGVQEIEKSDLRELEQAFDERTAAPHIAQLANDRQPVPAHHPADPAAQHEPGC